MKNQEQNYVQLENFEGPLEFLLYLAQKDEIDLSDIRLQAITEMFLKELQQLDVEQGAEFIGLAASLLFLKSQRLLPKEQQQLSEEEEEGPDPHFEVIHQLVDYCKFKEAGKELVVREFEQQGYYPRGGGTAEVKKPLGIEHLSLDDLALLFKDILENAREKTGLIFEEDFRVPDKISAILGFLSEEPHIFFSELFTSELSRQELIVTFLALLELMKVGEIAVIRKESDILIIPQRREDLESRN